MWLLHKVFCCKHPFINPKFYASYINFNLCIVNKILILIYTLFTTGFSFQLWLWVLISRSNQYFLLSTCIV